MKKIYEKPRSINLGEVADTAYGDCLPGSLPSTCCQDGNLATNAGCIQGNMAGNRCETGQAAVGNCKTGTGVS